MKFRKDAAPNPEPDAREDVRAIAEALSLYRSAMHHLAEREAARPFVRDPRAHVLRLRMVLAPALTVALAVSVLVPAYSHFHHHRVASTVVANNTHLPASQINTSVDDTALMNQIDSELSEEVPDALQPLADLSDQTTSSTPVTEKKNVTKE